MYNDCMHARYFKADCFLLQFKVRVLVLGGDFCSSRCRGHRATIISSICAVSRPEHGGATQS